MNANSSGPDKWALLGGTAPAPSNLPATSSGGAPYTGNRDRIVEEVKLLHALHHRRIQAEALKVWADECEKYAGAVLWEVLRQGRFGERCPTIGQVLDACRARAPKPQQEHPQLTLEQREKSERAAIMSLLWLHYEHGLTPELAQAFKQQTGEPAGAALLRARERYPRAIVQRWMADQKRAGN